MLCFENFKNVVIDLLKKEHPEHEFREADVPKTNYHYIGVSIGTKEEKGGVVVNLTEYYANYLMNEKTIQEIVLDVWDKYMKFTNEDYNIKVILDVVTDFEKVKDKIFCKVINREKNQDALLTMPHMDVLNLICVFYIDLGFAITNIGNHLLDVWKISSEELEKIAIENTIRESKITCENIYEMLKHYEGQEKMARDENIPMWIVRMSKDDSEEYGARIILFKELLSNVLDEYSNIPKQCFIIPSSVHELIIVPCEGSVAEINEMIRSVNSMVLDEEYFLSDEAYYFDREKNDIKILN